MEPVSSTARSTNRPRRRDGPWHRGLDRDAVVAEALRILDAEGRPALTMRRLAKSLGVEAPSIYAHIGGKDALVDAVLDRVLDSIELPEAGSDAHAALKEGLTSYRHALVAHPAVVLLMTERAYYSRSQVRLIQRSLELLEGAGYSTRSAVDAHVTLVAYVLGFILQEVSRPTQTPRQVADASPVFSRALTVLRERSVDDRFEVGMDLILRGLSTEGP